MTTGSKSSWLGKLTEAGIYQRPKPAFDAQAPSALRPATWNQNKDNLTWDLSAANEDLDRRSASLDAWDKYLEQAEQNLNSWKSRYESAQDAASWTEYSNAYDLYSKAVEQAQAAYDEYNSLSKAYTEAYRAQNPDWKEQQERAGWAGSIGDWDDEGGYRLTASFADILKKEQAAEAAAASARSTEEYERAGRERDFYRQILMNGAEPEKAEDVDTLRSWYDEQIRQLQAAGTEAVGDMTAMGAEYGVTERRYVNQAQIDELERARAGLDQKKYDLTYAAEMGKLEPELRGRVEELRTLEDRRREILYAVENGTGSAEGLDEINERISGTTAEMRALGYTQKQIDDMADYGKRQQNAREMDTLRESISREAGDRGSFGNWLLATLNSLGSGVGYADLAIQGGVNALRGKDSFTGEGRLIDYNSGAMKSYYRQEEINEAQQDKWYQKYYSELGDEELAAKKAQRSMFLFQLSESMGQSAAVAGLTALGMPAATLLLSGSAATAATMEAHEKGASDGAALMIGAISGAAEYITEQYSVEALLSMKSPTSVKAVVGNVLRQMLSEGSEEVASDLINTLADVIINGDLNDIDSAARQYRAEHPEATESEAQKAAFLGWTKDVGMSFLGGALSGGIMGGLGTAAMGGLQMIGDTVRGAKIQNSNNVSSLQKIVGTIDKDIQRLTGMEPMKAESARNVGRTLRQAQQADMYEAITTRLQELGETKISNELLTAIEAEARGERLSRAEKRAFAESDLAEQVAGEYEAAMNGEESEGNRWALERMAGNAVTAEILTTKDQNAPMAERLEQKLSRKEIEKILDSEELRQEFTEETGKELPAAKGEARRIVQEESRLRRLEALRKGGVNAETETRQSGRESAERGTGRGAGRNSAATAAQSIEMLNTQGTDYVRFGGVEYSTVYDAATESYTARAVDQATGETVFERKGLADRYRAAEALQQAQRDGTIRNTETVETTEGDLNNGNSFDEGERQADEGAAGQSAGAEGAAAEGTERSGEGARSGDPAEVSEGRSRGGLTEQAITAAHRRNLANPSEGMSVGRLTFEHVYEYKNQDNDAEADRVRSRLTALGAKSVTIFTGEVTVDGEALDVSGYIDNEGNIFLRGDDPDVTLRELGLHEYYHLAMRQNNALREDAMDIVMERYSTEELADLISRYRSVYDAVYGRYDAEGNLTNVQEIEDMVVEEICADAYAGRNQGYRAGTEKISGDVRGMMKEHGREQLRNTLEQSGTETKDLTLQEMMAEVVRRTLEQMGVQTQENARSENESAQTENESAQAENENAASEDGDGGRFAVERYDYSKSFKEQLEDYKAGKHPQGDTFVMGPTPRLLQRLGLNALPMTMNKEHVDAALNGTKDKQHHIGKAGLLSLLEKMEEPMAVITSKTERGTSIVVLVEMKHDNRNVIVPVYVDGHGKQNGLIIDSNAATSTYAKDYAQKLFDQALMDEAYDGYGVLYLDKEKAAGLIQGARVLMPKNLAFTDGFIHSIRESGSPVNTRLNNVTESQQFKRWFGDWKKHPGTSSQVVDENGQPMVVYHGTNADFNTFQSRGGLYWFSQSRDYAEAMAEERGGERIVEAYLSMKKPYRATLAEGEFSDPSFEAPHIKAAKEGGYDGIIFDVDTDNEIVKETFYVVFEPTQIKSATDNIGLFDPNNPDIRYSVEERRKSEAEHRADMAELGGEEDSLWMGAADQSGYARGRVSYDEIQRREAQDRSRRERQREAVTRTSRREDFHATEAMDELGVQIEGSIVPTYLNVDALRKAGQEESRAKREAQRIVERYGMSSAEQSTARMVANGQYTEEMIPRNMNSAHVMELAEAYAKEDELGGETIRRQREKIQEGPRQAAEQLFADSEKYNPNRFGMLSKAIMNERTPERVCRMIFGQDQGQKIYQYYFRPVEANEAQRIRWVNRQYDEVREVQDSRGNYRQLNDTESELAQQVLEGRAFEEQAARLEGYDRETFDAHIENYHEWMQIMHEQGAAAARNAAERILAGEMTRAQAEEEGVDSGLLERFIRNRAAAAEMTTLSPELQKIVDGYEWYEQIRERVQALNDADATIIDNAARLYAEKYDQFYRAINEFLVAHGYDEIGFIQGYAPHMQSEENQGVLRRALTGMGIQLDEVSSLPAGIAGRTADFKPNMKWNPHFQTRTGNKTDYNIVKGYERYVAYLSDIFHHTDDIMKVRQAVNYYRSTYGGDEIAANLSAANAIRNASTAEKINFLQGTDLYAPGMSAAQVDAAIEQYVSRQYEGAQKLTKYSEWTTWLENYANILAGKQSLADRGLEYTGGRKMLNVSQTLMRTFQRANVAGSLSSALNQTAQLPMIATHLGAKYTMRALRDIGSGEIARAGFLDRSDFLTGKGGIEYINQTGWEKFLTKISMPATFTDSLMSQLAVRGEYLRQIDQGVNEAEAMRRADDFARRVMGSRQKGSKPQGFESKRLVSQMLHVFQVEVSNSFDYVVSDMPQEIKNAARRYGREEAAKRAAAAVVAYLLQAFALNRLGEEVYGGTPVPFDLLGMTTQFFASGQGMRANRYLQYAIDNGYEELFGERLFGTDPDEAQESFNWDAAIGDTWYTMTNDLPYISNALGVAGIGDQALPTIGVNDIVSGAQGVVKGLKGNDGMLAGQDTNWGQVADSAMSIASQVIPGGRQLRKAYQGAVTMAKGGTYTGYGDQQRLRYPVEKNVWNWTRALLFGRNALPEQNDFYASEAKALTAGQTFVYKALVANGMDRQQAYDTLQEYRAVKGNDSMDSLERGIQRRSIIAGMDVSDAGKLEAYLDLELNGDAESKRYQAFVELMGAGMSFNQLMEAYNQFQRIDSEDLRAAQKATEFAKWVDDYCWEQRLDSEVAEMLKADMVYYSGASASATGYEALVGAGLSNTTAERVALLWSNLTPEAGKQNVTVTQKLYAVSTFDISEADKYGAAATLMDETLLSESGDPTAYAVMRAAQRAGMDFDDYLKLKEAGNKRDDQVAAVTASNLDEERQMDVLRSILSENDYFKLEQAGEYGVTPEVWSVFLQTLPAYDSDGNGTYKQAEVTAALQTMGKQYSWLSNDMLAALWQMKTGGAKNPFDRQIGSTMKSEYETWKNGGKE